MKERAREKERETEYRLNTDLLCGGFLKNIYTIFALLHCMYRMDGLLCCLCWFSIGVVIIGGTHFFYFFFCYWVWFYTIIHDNNNCCWALVSKNLYWKSVISRSSIEYSRCNALLLCAKCMAHTTQTELNRWRHKYSTSLLLRISSHPISLRKKFPILQQQYCNAIQSTRVFFNNTNCNVLWPKITFFYNFLLYTIKCVRLERKVIFSIRTNKPELNWIKLFFKLTIAF